MEKVSDVWDFGFFFVPLLLGGVYVFNQCSR